MSKQPCKLILALDLPDKESAIDLLHKTREELDWVKIGLQMYLKYGEDFVRQVAAMGYKIFLDLKLYDIPNTVANAVTSISSLPVSLLTIHASGGDEMMKAALKAATDAETDLEIVAVTVLTSFDDEALCKTGIKRKAKSQVKLLANLAAKSGVKTLVCSPQEIAMLKKFLPKDVKLITPGIRPAGADKNEQKRIMTPKKAANAGADYIVVGRPILMAADPDKAAKEIIAEIEE